MVCTQCTLLVILSVLQLRVVARSILDVPWEARRTNIVRVTRQECDECSTLDDLYRDNHLVFLLFHERNLVSHHAYKGAIVAGFHEVCKDLRWSKVTCGIVDMLEDRTYAEKYIDPKTAPAHIAVQGGEPVPSKKEWIQKLLAKPGDKGTMLWHLKQQLVPDELGEALQISMEISRLDLLEPLANKHEVLLVANLAAEGGASRASVESFRAFAQQLLLLGKVPAQVPVSQKAGASKKAGKKQQQLRQRARLFFAVLTRDSPSVSVPRGQIAAFVRGQSQPARPLKAWDSAENLEIMKDVVLAAISAIPAGKVQSERSVPDMLSFLFTAFLQSIDYQGPVCKWRLGDPSSSAKEAQGKSVDELHVTIFFATPPMWNRGGSTSKETEQQSLLGAVAGIYAELLKGAECGVPESVTYDRSAEIDLSHEFPPEQREAQVDPEAAFHRPLRVCFAETASIQVAT
ncbi:hypothetical protein AK812_SmicGene39334 [Symbiodinium microadriaticum]|uniref:Uncharacterized protein n=1 Tax=Symbiodinium microadriaticum TaxID=2951 RepID=A0A1Q9CBG1_SYMMI|nr:hypothetical protein AK812_SmicGene39334 [Symbiodinium microadriaticum]